MSKTLRLASGRPTTRAEDEGDLGVVGGHGPHGLLVPEGIAEDDVGLVELRDVAQGQLHVAGVPEGVGEVVLDATGVLLGLERRVDDPVPGLLDLGGVGAEDLERGILGEGRAASRGRAEHQQPCSCHHLASPEHR